MIDPTKLPGRVMLDSNVLYFAFDTPRGRPQEAPSRELWDALVAHQCAILIATPTLAECFRSGVTIPPVRGLEVISFDAPAARILGAALPLPVLKQSGVQASVTSTRIKFDSLIIACAARGRANVLITYDHGFTALKANAVGTGLATLNILKPDDFQVPQPAVQTSGQPAAQPASPSVNVLP